MLYTEFNKNVSHKFLIKFTEFLSELILIIIKRVPKAPEYYIFASNAVLFIFCNSVWDADLFQFVLSKVFYGEYEWGWL